MGEAAEATGSLLGAQVFNYTELRLPACTGGLGCNPVPWVEGRQDFLARAFLDTWWDVRLEPAIFASFSPSLPQIFIKPLLCVSHLETVYRQMNNQPFFVCDN